MCGLVGIAGNIIARDVTLFSQMLMADELRGKHATGIARITKNLNDMPVHHAKLALAASYFRHLPVFDMITSPTTNLTALLGHNRHATKGASDQHKNAHPFKHGHITLMHNGSLTTHHAISKGTFTVDSEAICAGFAEDGAEAVIPKLRGAFALVWADQEKQTLNFVRNSERPLSIAFNTKTNKMYWASEKDMLKWLLDRDMTFASGGFDYDDIVELPTGEIWSFPLKPNSANLQEREVTKVELATAWTYNSYSNNWNQGGNKETGKKSGSAAGNSTSNVTRIVSGRNVQLVGAVDNSVGDKYLLSDKLEEGLGATSECILERLGKTYSATRAYISLCDLNVTQLDRRIPFFSLSFETYTGSTNAEIVTGKIIGRMVEYPFSKIIIHAAKRSDYLLLKKESNSVGSAFITGATADVEITGQLTLSAKEAKESMTLLLRSDTLKQVEDVTLTMFDSDNIPKEWELLASDVEVKRVMDFGIAEKEVANLAKQKKH